MRERGCSAGCSRARESREPLTSGSGGTAHETFGASGASGATRTDDHELLSSFFPELRFVWLRRRDVVAQAVSWAKAIQSGHWHHWDPRPAVDVEFRSEAIDHLAREIRSHDAAWRRWFETNGIEPVLVTYEELAGEPERVTREVLDGLGLTPLAEVSISTDTELQRDELNEEWAARYRRLRGA